MAPAVAGDLAVIGSCGGTIYGLDVENGTPTWSYDTRQDGEPAQFHGEALIQDGVLYIGADGQRNAFLYAIDVTSGEVIWKQPFAFGVPSRVLGFEDSMAFVTGEGVLVSLDLRDGAERWRREPMELSPGRQRVSAVASGGSIIYHASDGNLFVIEASSGRVQLETSLGSAATVDPTNIGKQIFVGMEEGSIIRVDLDAGKAVADIRLDARLYGALGTDGERVFALALDRDGTRLICLDSNLESVLWEQRAEEWTTFRPLIGNGSITAGTASQFCSFRTDDGDVIACTPIEGTSRSFALEGDTMFVGTIQGRVLAFAQDATRDR